jgi:two-component system nitrogen regulation response regulator NtrX
MSMSSTHPNQSKAILVVDDDGDIRQSLEMLLRFEGFEVLTARDGEEAWTRLERDKDAPPAAVLTDLKMPKMDGLQLLEKIQGMEDPPPVVLISGHGDVATAVTAMQTGAANFLEKPLDDNRVLVTLRAVLRTQKLEEENTSLRERLHGTHRLIGSSPALQALREQILQVAASPASVLITGENGSGKEVLARSIHAHSPQASGPFITVNCAAIPSELIESELFGHEKGSFTGATSQRIGHFEAASGGTLFLDEIGDMPLAAQAKVLRALETLEVTRVGGSQNHPVDIRVLAATNADLTQSVEDKTFRMDLFYRLNVVPLRAPALREHPTDIAEIAAHLLTLQAERSGRRAPAIHEDALSFLANAPWPGNVRQLRNVLQAATVFTTGDVLLLADFERVLQDGPGLIAPAGASTSPAGPDPFNAATFEDFKNQSEALFFKARLERNDGNIKRTAEELGMQRSHLYKKLDRYELR